MLTRTRQRPIWLLDLDVGGRIYRYATEAADVSTTARGASPARTYRYEAGLAPLEVGRGYMLGRRSVSVEVNAQVDWALVVRRGIPLEGRRAVLRIWYSGDALELAEVVQTGTTERVRYGAPGEPLSFTVASDPLERGLTLPPETATANDNTWPVRALVLQKVADGAPYPVIFGYPGDHPKPGAATDIAEPAVKAPWVEHDATATLDDRWVVAHGRIDAAQATLYYYDSSTGNFQPGDQSITEVTDSLGQLVSVIDMTTLADAGDWYVGFRNASGFGGGMISPYTGSVLRGAGELSRFILDYFADVDLDVPRLVGAGAWLDRFKIDAALGERVNAVQWLQDEVWSLLPVIGVQGESGFYLAPLRWDATTQDAVAWLDADAGQVALEGDLVQWDEPIYNSFTLRYRVSAATGEPATTRTISAINGAIWESMTAGANLPPISSSLPWIATTQQDIRTWGSALCHRSQASHGVLPWSRTSRVLWDDATAALVLQYLVHRYAWPKRQGRYIGGPDLAALTPGAVVVLNDDDHQLTNAVALVLDVTVGGADVALDLVVLDHPFQTTRATA